MTEGTHWTPEMEARLADLWRQDISVGERAEQLGVTRESAASKARRLGVTAPPSERWPVQRIELLKQLWEQGYSSAQIAAELGDNLSRSAIIGKAHRLGLAPRRAAYPRLPFNPNAAPGPKRGTPLVANMRKARAAKRERPVLEVVPKMPSDQSEHAIGYFDHKSGQCAFPLWGDETPILDRQFCGSPVCQRPGPFGDMVDVEYCARHHSLMRRYTPKPDERIRRGAA